MTISDWLVIGAIIIAPVFAIQIQKLIEKIKEEKGRKVQIFRILMATRATPLAPLHVEALNLIDIEFYKHKNVTDIWRQLLDNFGNYPKDPQANDFTARLTACSDKSNELLTNLLYEMSKLLGYTFDKVLLKRGCYIPKGHGDIEMEETSIRKSLTELFEGKKSIPINIVKNENV